MKKRKRSKVATIEQLLAATHRARHDWVHSQVYQNFEKGIRDCPENAGCYTAFKACQSLQGNQEIRPSDRARIEEVLARWKNLRDYCPHCSQELEKVQGTRAYSNYRKAIDRLRKRLGADDTMLIGVLLDKKETPE